MKVLAVERLWNEWHLTAGDLDNYELAPPARFPVTLATDSALVRRGMPVFLPDFAAGWKFHLFPYVVISRLGKSIPCRFAGRYYSGIGLAARLMPPEADRPLAHLNALTANFDGAIVPGITLPDSELTDSRGNITVTLDAALSVTLRPEDLHINETISFISRYMTLKTGDMILLCDTGLSLPAAIDITAEASANGKPMLSIRTK